MALYSRPSAGTREGKHWGKEYCFHDDKMGKSDGGWLRQKDGSALKDGHWRMGTGGWALEDGHWRMGTGGWALEDGHWRMGIGGWALDGAALEGGPNGHRVSPEMKDLVQTTDKAGFHV